MEKHSRNGNIIRIIPLILRWIELRGNLRSTNPETVEPSPNFHASLQVFFRRRNELTAHLFICGITRDGSAVGECPIEVPLRNRSSSISEVPDGKTPLA